MKKDPDWNAFATVQTNRAATLCRYVDGDVLDLVNVIWEKGSVVLD